MNLRFYTHKYDIRGLVKDDFGPKEAYSIGRGFSTFIRNNGGNSVVVGHDVRDSSKEFSKNLINGFVDSGIDVLDCGLCVTPLSKFASILYRTKNSVMVTASHNNLKDNGFKFTLDFTPFYGDSLEKLCDVIEESDFYTGNGNIKKIDILDLYTQNIARDFIISSNLRVLWICENSILKTIVSDLILKIPGQHGIVNEYKEDIASQYNVTFQFDTDGDRFKMIEPGGYQWSGDETLAFFALNMKKEIGNVKAVFDLKASRVLVKWLESIGIQCEFSRVGSCFIDAKMRSTNADVGGEVSGHFMFKDYNSLSDDGIYCAVRALHYLSQIGCSLKEVRQCFPEMYISKSIKINCPDDCNKKELIDSIREHVKDTHLISNEENAVLAQYPHGWFVIRASQTENALSVRCEGFDQKSLNSIQDRADSLLSIVGLSLW